MSQKKNEGIPFSAEIRVVGSYTDRLLICMTLCVTSVLFLFSKYSFSVLYFCLFLVLV